MLAQLRQLTYRQRDGNHRGLHRAGRQRLRVALKKNSVKGKHIAKNAVTSPKVKNRSLKRTDFAAGQLPTGDPGPKGDQGPPGPGEETAISFSAMDSSPATVRTLVFSGDGLTVEASCGTAATSNLTLWVASTVNDAS